MDTFVLFAEPWWVNIFILVPVVAYILFKKKLNLTNVQLGIATLFGIAFGFVESSVVIYLRAATGLSSLSAKLYQPNLVLDNLSIPLFTTEFFREVATIVMLVTIAMLTAKTVKERIAVFLWIFSFWDIFYYVWLWVTIGWPTSLLTQDVLFLIPTQWVAQVWYPCLVSGATILVIFIKTKNSASM